MDRVPKGLAQSLIVSAQITEPCVISIVEGVEDYLFREFQAYRVDLVMSNFQPSMGNKKEFMDQKNTNR